MHSIFATLNLIRAMEAAIHSARGAVGEQSEECQKTANLKNMLNYKSLLGAERRGSVLELEFYLFFNITIKN